MRSALMTAGIVVMVVFAPSHGATASASTQATATGQQPLQEPDKADADYSARMSAGMDAYVQARFPEAARSFEAAVHLRPGSSEAQYWAGQALVYGRQPAAAIVYLEAAHTLGVDSIALHLALVSAYAGTGRNAELDRERELLHRWHDDGSHSTLAARQGFIVETFFIHRWHVNAEEYFNQHSANGTVWRFIVRDPAEIVEMTYLLQTVSPESGSASVPRSKPGTAYVLIRQTHRDGELEEKRVLHRYASLPSYSEVKAAVAAKLHLRIPAN